MKNIVYIGSFDPFHKGHQEAIQIIQEKTQGRIIILPNNPRKGKPNRSPLFIRTFNLQQLYPIYLGYQNWKDSKEPIIVDSSPVDQVLSQISESSDSYSAIIGSDILVQGKKPKYQPDQWFVIERMGYPVSQTITTFAGKPINVIKQEETQYQYLSSILIRDSYFESVSLEDVLPKVIANHYQRKRTLGLSPSVKTSYNLEKKVYQKTFENSEKIQEYFENYLKIAELIQKTYLKMILDLPIITRNQFNSQILEVQEIPSAKTLYDLVLKGQLESIHKFIIVLDLLHHTYQNNPWRYGDLSVMNILVSEDEPNKYYLIDYENFQEPVQDWEMMEDYYLFLSSIIFYGNLNGIDLRNQVIKLEKSQDYTFKNCYPEKSREIRQKYLN